MEKIKVIPVRGSGERLEVVDLAKYPMEVTLDVNPDTALEGVRSYFQERWDASIRALRWLFPEGLLWANEDLSPFLVVYMETIGRLPQTSVESKVGIQDTYDDRRDNLDPILKAAVEPCLSEPWSSPAWLPRMSDWVLDNFGNAAQRITQVRTCPNGAVIKIQCAGDMYFVKTQPAPLAYESGLLRVLNQRIPGSCPEILAIRPNLDSHVTKGIVGSPIGSNACSRTWQAALGDVAKIQIQSTSLVREFRQAGVPCHTFMNSAAGLEEILNGLVVLQNGLSNELAPNELRKVAKLADKSAHDCDVLAQCNLPETLVHADLNQNNIFRTEAGGTVLIDWALSRVSHPFFTLGSALFARFDSDQKKQPIYQKRCISYLQPWLDFAESHRLQAGLEAASRFFWIDSTFAASSLCRQANHGTLVNLPRFLRAILRAYDLSI
jgi:Phosphotransferase enzyme family